MSVWFDVFEQLFHEAEPLATANAGAITAKQLVMLCSSRADMQSIIDTEQDELDVTDEELDEMHRLLEWLDIVASSYFKSWAIIAAHAAPVEYSDDYQRLVDLSRHSQSRSWWVSMFDPEKVRVRKRIPGLLDVERRV